MSILKPNNSNLAKSILIVEDDEMLLNLLMDAFEMYGLNAYRADNGFDGLDIFHKNHPDIVLTDIRMPGLNGLKLSRQIRNTSSNTIIALMTGGSADLAEELLKDGTVNHLFIKPFPLSLVCKTLSAEVQAA